MTSVATQVGALSIPLAAGAANSRFPDPLADALKAYIGHWIKWALDAKLAVIGGPDNVVVSDACPTANRFSYDAGGWWVRTIVETKKPGLWVWGPRAKRTPYTILYELRERPMSFLYAFPDQLWPRGADTRSGLIDVVDAALRRAFDRGSHPTYQNDVQFAHTIAQVDSLALTFEDSETSLEFAAPQTGAGAGGRADGGLQQYGIHTLRGTILAKEKILLDSFVDPDDALGDLSMTFTHNEQGDTNNGMVLLEGTLPGPDGSCDGDELV